MICSSLIEIEFLPNTPISAKNSEVIFTSVNGVNACQGSSNRAFCVGEKTTRAARDAGFDALSANGNAADLIDLITRKAKGPLIHIRGEHSRGDIAKQLQCEEVIAYKQVAKPLSNEARKLLCGEQLVILPLFSPRTARLFIAEMGDVVAPIHIIAISDAVAHEVSGHKNIAITIADAPNADAMLLAIQGHYDA